MRGLALALALASGCGSASEPGIAGSPSAGACGTCHTEEYAAWRSSPLATSGTSPVFQALSARAGAAWGSASENRCVACHRPGYGGDHGIGCVACHSATGNLANRDGLLVVDTTRPVSGPFANPLPTPAHGSEAYGFLESPDLCGTCHEVTGPALFQEPTLTQFEASPAAAGGATCATCHMPSLASAPIAPGTGTARPRAGHAFIGMDPPWGAPAAVAAAAAASTLALLRSGLTLSARGDGDGLAVTVGNGAGHAVPTGVAFLRGVWVDVDFADARGASATAASVVSLGSQPTRGGVPVPLITDADAVTESALAPGATTSVHVDLPGALTPPLRAVITLRARAVRPGILDALGLDRDAALVPTHEVATVVLDDLGRP
jgi:hypothetical protein